MVSIGSDVHGDRGGGSWRLAARDRMIGRLTGSSSVTRIRWTTEAADQLERIVKHILQDNPEAARKVARAIS